MSRNRSGHRATPRAATPLLDRLLACPVPRYSGCDDSNGGRADISITPDACRIHVVDYGVEHVIEHLPLQSLAQFPITSPRAAPARWVSVEGACATEVDRIRSLLDVPYLLPDAALSECIAPRLEVFDTAQVLLVCHAPVPLEPDDDKVMKFSQVSFFVDVKKNLFLTLCGANDVGAEELRARILALVQGNTDDVRRHSVIHLLCVAITVMVDRFYPALERESEELDEVEALLLGDTDFGEGKDIVKRIAGAKRSMLSLRRRVWPFRKCLTRLSLVPFPSCDSRLYFRDVLDHVIQVLDVLEIHRDAAHSLLDIYLGAQNNRMQEIMQKIAVVTTIFVPLTFLTGLEGMNFQHMPELRGRYSYLTFLVIVIFMVVTMVLWFKRRRWL